MAWRAEVLVAAALAWAAGSAAAAGFQRIEVPAAGDEPAIRAVVWTPCAQPAAPTPLGPWIAQATPGCAVAGESLPLVVISHGNGGSLASHHDTATALADAGFVAVTFNHPGNSAGDSELERQPRVFETRPQDASRVIDWLLQNWPQRDRLDAGAVGVWGFSRGGYTALALAGAVPSVAASAVRHCGHWWDWFAPLCRRLRWGDARIAPEPDERIRAAVAVDPLNLFDAAGLKSVRVPVQLWGSELGGDGVALEDVEAVRDGLPRPPDWHLARGAGHFAYLAPCPPALKKEERAICEDPAGFDREAWHREMNAAVVEFFRQHLQANPRSGKP